MNPTGCWFGFINGTGYISFRTIYKPAQRSLNTIERENMKTTVVKQTIMNLNRINTSIYFRSARMTAKLKGDGKAAPAGQATGSKPSGPGASTTPPPPMKQ